MIDLTDKDKAEVLAKLYNASRRQGMGFVHCRPDSNKDMTIAEARRLLSSGDGYFDYLNGRVLKIDLSGTELDPHLYDRDNGHGAAARALSANAGVERHAPETNCDSDEAGVRVSARTTC